MLEVWQKRLRLQHYTGRCQRISAWQVTGDDGQVGAELVGVVVEDDRFTIVHTRPLTEHDIIHELLHVAFPAWDHPAVELWTDLLFGDAAWLDHLEQFYEAGIPVWRRTMSNEQQEVRAFNLRTRREVVVKDPEVVTMKNGRKAVVGTASDDGTTRVFRILSQAEASELEGASGADASSRVPSNETES